MNLTCSFTIKYLARSIGSISHSRSPTNGDSYKRRWMAPGDYVIASYLLGKGALKIAICCCLESWRGRQRPILTHSPPDCIQHCLIAITFTLAIFRACVDTQSTTFARFLTVDRVYPRPGCFTGRHSLLAASSSLESALELQLPH